MIDLFVHIICSRCGNWLVEKCELEPPEGSQLSELLIPGNRVVLEGTIQGCHACVGVLAAKD